MITNKNGFNVVCKDPAKRATVEPCWYSYDDWTEETAIQNFATHHKLELSEVAIEKED